MPDISPSSQPINVVTWDMITNSMHMTNSPNQVPSEAQVYLGDQAVLAVANSKTAIRYYVNGIAQNGTPVTNDVIMWTETVNTLGGSTTSFVTTQGATRTSGGTALCSSIFPDSIQTNFIDSSGVYAQGLPVITSNKTIVIPFTKQGFNGVTILGINALGTASMGTIPDGVVVKLQLIGIAV